MQWYEALWPDLMRVALAVSAIAGAAICAASLLLARKLVVGLVLAVFAPVPVRVNLKFRGELGKTWFAAGALEILDCVTIAFAAAHGIDPIAQIYLLDFKLLHRTISKRMQESLADRMHDELMHDEGGLIRKLERFRARVERWFDLRPLKDFALRLRRFIRIVRVDGQLVYSLSDFAWTGMTLGFLYTVAGLLTPLGTFRIEPKWEEITRGEGKLDAQIDLLPVRIVLSTLVFSVMNVKLRKPRKPKLPPDRAMHMEAQHGR